MIIKTSSRVSKIAFRSAFVVEKNLRTELAGRSRREVVHKVL